MNLKAKLSRQWLRKLGSKSAALTYSSLLAICLLSVVYVILYWSSRIFPWWADGGIWLKQMNAISGRDYPMWSQKPLQFDQLYFLLLTAAYALLRDGLLALKFTAILASVIRPASTFILAEKAFKSNLAGLAAALLSGFHTLFYETLGWGGYPNMLAYAILPITFYAILRLIEEQNIKNYLIVTIAVASTALSHNLGFFILFGVLMMWLTLTALQKFFSHLKCEDSTIPILYSLLILILMLVLQIMFFGLPPYDYYNEAAYYRCRVGFADLVWAIKDTATLVTLIAITTIWLTWSMLFNVKSRARYGSAFVSWILAPVLISQVYLVGIALDYRRVFLYAIQPTLITAVAPIGTLLQVRRSFHTLKNVCYRQGSKITLDLHRAALSIRKVWASLLLIFLSLSVLCIQVSIGVCFPKIVNDWYSASHVDPYGDREKYDALQWIKENTLEDSVFVADEALGRWIEGLAARRVLMNAPLQALFVKGEAERSEAARTILESNHELKNGLVRVSDQTPYGNYTASISFRKDGLYENVLYFNDADSIIFVTNGTDTWFEQLFRGAPDQPKIIQSDSGSAELNANYDFGSFSVEKRILINRGQAGVSLQYLLRISDVRFRLINFTTSAFSSEGKGFDNIYVPFLKAIRVRVGSLQLTLSLAGAVEQALLVDSPGTDKLIFAFTPQSTKGQLISATITISTDVREAEPSALTSVTRSELLKEFGVSYIAIPTISGVLPSGTILLKPLSKLLYNHLLEDPSLTVVYENTRVIILKVKDGLSTRDAPHA